MVKERFRKSWSTTSRRGWVLTKISWHRSGTITEEWERELYGGEVPATPGVFVRHEGTTVPPTAGQTQQEEEDSSDGAEDQPMQQDAQPRTQDAQPATEAAQPATGDAASSHTRAAN
eukprot:3137518-Lingulodinium_polyedra.AAC.1